MFQLDLVQSMNSTHALIDSAWNIFIFVHVAFIGGVYSIKRTLTNTEISLAFVLYICFAYLNCTSLIYSYELYNVIAAEISGGSNEFPSSIKKFVSLQMSENRKVLVIIIHLVAAVLISSVLFVCRRWVPSENLAQFKSKS